MDEETESGVVVDILLKKGKDRSKRKKEKKSEKIKKREERRE